MPNTKRRGARALLKGHPRTNRALEDFVATDNQVCILHSSRRCAEKQTMTLKHTAAAARGNAKVDRYPKQPQTRKNKDNGPTSHFF